MASRVSQAVVEVDTVNESRSTGLVESGLTSLATDIEPAITRDTPYAMRIPHCVGDQIEDDVNSPELIAWRLVRHGLTPEDIQQSFISTDEQCGICREPYENKVTLHCGHCFCVLCILEWGVKSNSCPMCRVVIYPSTRERTTFEDITGAEGFDGQYDNQQHRFINPDIQGLYVQYVGECYHSRRANIILKKKIAKLESMLSCMGEENARLNKEMHHGEEPVDVGGNMPRRYFNVKMQIINDIIEAENKWNIKRETSDKRIAILSRVSAVVLPKYLADVTADKNNYIAGHCSMARHYRYSGLTV